MTSVKINSKILTENWEMAHILTDRAENEICQN